MSLVDLTKRHYQALLPRESDQEHPVDRMIAALPEIAAVDAAARRMATHVGRNRATLDQAAWIRYEDLRLRQRALHHERYFDVGWELGRMAGLAEAGQALDAAAELTQAVRSTLLTLNLRREVAAAALLALTRGVILAEITDGNA